MADFGITLDGPRTFFVNGDLDMATVPIMNIAIVDAVARGGPISMDLLVINFTLGPVGLHVSLLSLIGVLVAYLIARSLF